MDTQNLNLRTIAAFRNLLDLIAEHVFEDRKSVKKITSKVSLLDLQKQVAGKGPIRQLSSDDWRALIEAALPEMQRLIDQYDGYPDADARELIDGLPEAEPKNVDERYIQHIIQSAAEVLKLMMNSDEVSVTPEKLAAKLEFRFGEVPIPNYWKEFVREHRDEIMLKLSLELSQDLEDVLKKLNDDTDAAEDEDGQADVESQDDLEEMLSMGVGHLVETQHLSQRVQDVLNGLEARVLADVVVHDPSELKSFHGFGPKSLEELEVALSEYGLELGMDISKELRERAWKRHSHTETVLRKPVHELDLSVRSHNCLKAANINTIGELVRHEAEEMLKYRHFGRKSLQELVEILDEYGLEFGMDVDAILEGDNEG